MMIKKVIMFILMVFLASNTYVLAKISGDITEKFDQAKTNLVLGDLELAEKQFKELAAFSEPKMKTSECYQDLYSDIMYNLGLVYEIKYEQQTPDKDLMGESTAEAALANEYFKKASPEIIPDVIAMAGAQEAGLKSTSEVRAVGGIVGKVIQGKVKDWLKAKENCSCSFTNAELDLAGKTFIALTEKTDIPALKDLKSRYQKIKEIFSRINKYVTTQGKTSPLGVLYYQKIQTKCKI